MTERDSAKDIFADDILRPDESNFSILPQRVQWLHQQLSQSIGVRPGQRAVNPAFRYPDDNAEFPDAPQSFEAAARASMEAFEGCLRWHHPHALFNITPSPLIDTVALSAMTMLYNPNALWDITSGKFLLFEQRIVRHLAHLAGWRRAHAGGLFTSGGKATLMYAVKSGINRCDRAAVASGLNGDYVVLVSQNCHFSLESICNFLGLGHRACRRIRVDARNVIDVDALEYAFRGAAERGQKVAAIVLSGGGTTNMSVDPAGAVRRMLDRVCAEMSLAYTPHIHLDAVISWAWLAFEHNPDAGLERVPDRVRDKLRRTITALREIRDGDSFGADFHKTGLSPYSSSCYVAQDATDLLRLDRESGAEQFAEERYGDICHFDRTFENSRNCIGIISAYQVLQRLGTSGIRSYLTRLLVTADVVRNVIADQYSEVFEVVNNSSLGFENVVHIDLSGSGRSFKELELADPRVHQAHIASANRFREWLLRSEHCNRNPVPFIGFVPRYSDEQYKVGLPAFLMYSTSLHMSKAAAMEMLTRLRDAVHRYRLERVDDDVNVPSWDSRPQPPK